MPSRPLSLDKLNPKQFLINLQNTLHNNPHREVLLHFRIIQIESFLDVFPIVVPVIPDIEFTVKGKTEFGVFSFFECEQDLALFFANGFEFGF